MAHKTEMKFTVEDGAGDRLIVEPVTDDPGKVAEFRVNGGTQVEMTSADVDALIEFLTSEVPS